MPKVTGYDKLPNGREIPKFKKKVRVSVSSHRPHQYVIINMKSGHMYTPNRSDASRFATPSAGDLKLIARALKAQGYKC